MMSCGKSTTIPSPFIRMSINTVLITMCIFGAVACTPKNRVNSSIVLITLDTLRADHLGCYGNIHSRTPALDALSKKSRLFESVFTTAPETLPAHASLLTGMLPSAHGCLDNRYTLKPTPSALSLILTRFSYKTIAITNAILTLDRGFGQGFSLYNGAVPTSSEKSLPSKGYTPFTTQRLQFEGGKRKDPFRAERTTNRAIHQLSAMASERYFMWVHYWDAHAPWTPPEIYRNMFQCKKGEGREFFLPEERQTIFKNKIQLSASEQTRLRNLYDADIAQMDRELGRLLRAILRHSKNKALIAVTADHGESLYDRDFFIGHSLTLHNSVLYIPLLIKSPKLQRGIDTHLHSIVDIYHFLLTLSGLPVSQSRNKAFSLGELGNREFVISQANVNDKVAIQNREIKIVLDHHASCFSKYNLLTDATEQHVEKDKKKESPEVRKMQVELLHYFESLQRVKIQIGQPEPGTQVKKMLEELGYLTN